MDRTKTTRDSSKNSGEQDGKQSSLLENPNQVTSNDKLNAYGESESDATAKKGEECKTNTWRTRKIIHMEFESDDDMAEQSKNANHAKKEGKVRVTKRRYTIMNLVAKKRKEHMPTQKKSRKPMMITRIPKKDENDQALVSNEMILSSIGSNIFIGDSAATSHMTNNKTGVYDLQPIRGSVMIGNGESIS